ncbi:hypothetical protein [Sulfurimonas sp. HSL-1716]|uniref:hypothetical protein n=1 Tax=Hydrocurvibacter sulfurireducens TaxID=3131937 RepID=UPI0031F90AF3
MRAFSKLKHHIFNAFREIFIYNHNSLLFRAKLFALLVGVDNEEHDNDYYINLRSTAIKIYNDEDRADLLVLTTKEIVRKIRKSNEFNIDKLIESVVQELKEIPRYAKKIDKESLSSLLEVADDEETKIYQNRIIEFLDNLKAETYAKHNLTD